MADNSLEYLAIQIFSNDPQPAHSIRLDLSVEKNGEEDNINVRQLFEMLILLFQRGMVLKWGNDGHVDISKLTDDEMTLMVRYFHSIGIQPSIEIREMFIKKSFISNGDALKDYEFYLRLSDNMVCLLRFDFFYPRTHRYG